MPPAKRSLPKKEEPKKKMIRYFLAGNITDINNKALDSVKVAILDNSTNQAIEETYTKGEGTFGKVKMEEEKTKQLELQIELLKLTKFNKKLYN